MITTYEKNFERDKKKLKKYNLEEYNLDKIVSIVKLSENLVELSNNPLAYIYKFEKLKNDLTGLYSFNLLCFKDWFVFLMI